MTLPYGEIFEIYVGGEWVDISADVRVSSATSGGGVGLARGRITDGQRVDAGPLDLVIDQTDGRYSGRNPYSPYFGLLGFNTPIRVRTREVATAGTNGVVSTSLVAPSVDADAGLLVSMWLACDNTAGTYNLTVPVSMTAGAEVDESWSTSRTATETITAGATGERTATSNTSADRWAALSVVIPGAPVVEEALSDSAFNGDVTLTTGSGTQVGWWLLAMQGFDIVGNRLSAPSGDGWLEVGDSGGITQRLRAWVRRVDSSGAQAVVFANDTDGGQPDNHARLWVLSSWDGALPTRSARRYYGEVAEFPPRSDPSASDVWVPVQAYGILRRLGQGSTSLKSPVYREVMSDINVPHLVAYWPGEDGSDAKQVSSAVGHPPMTHTIAPPSFGNGDSFPGSQPLLTLVNGALIGVIPGAPGSGSISFRGLFHIPSGIASNALIADVYQSGGGSVRIWRLKHTSSGNLNLQGVQADGSTVVVESGGIGFDIRGARELIGFEVVQDGANVDYHIYTRHITSDGGVGSVIEGGYANTFASVTVGSPRTLVIAANGLMTSTVAGHFMVGSSDALTTTLDEAIVGYRGETAVARMTRLCGEEGVLFDAADGDSSVVGPQRVAPLLGLLQDAVDVDGGILFESRHQGGLSYRPRTSLYNQTSALALDYSARDLAPPLEPADDTRALTNDVTVTRIGGGSARATRETGRLSVLPPEQGGAGRYESSPLSVNADTDAQLPSMAGWLLHIGTWDEARYPVIKLNLTGLINQGKRELVHAAAAIDVGDLITIDNPPPWLPPDQIAAIVQGNVESLDVARWDLSFNATPAGPYRVFVLDDPVLGRLETAGSELVTSAAPGATSLRVVTTQGPLWPTGVQDFEINVSGAGLHVTNISSSPPVLNSNPYFESTASPWTTPDATIARSTAQFHQGVASLLLTPTGAAAAARAESEQITVVAGRSYRHSVWIRCAASRNVEVNIVWWTAGGSFISISSTPVAVVANTWTQLGATYTAPATAGLAAAQVRLTGTPSASHLTYIDESELTGTAEQTFTVDSVAVNGISKTLPAGSPVTTRGTGALAL